MRKGQTKESWWTKEKVEEMNALRLAERLTFEQVGKIYGVRKQRVHQLFKRFGIETDSQQSAEEKRAEKFLRSHLIPKETLIELYVNQKIKIVELIKILNKNSKLIYKNLEFHGIPKKGKGANQPPTFLSYDLLREMYIEKKMTAKKIAEELDYATITIQKRLSQLGITRPVVEPPET